MDSSRSSFLKLGAATVVIAAAGTALWRSHQRQDQAARPLPPAPQTSVRLSTSGSPELDSFEKRARGLSKDGGIDRDNQLRCDIKAWCRHGSPEDFDRIWALLAKMEDCDDNIDAKAAALYFLAGQGDPAKAVAEICQRIDPRGGGFVYRRTLFEDCVDYPETAADLVSFIEALPDCSSYLERDISDRLATPAFREEISGKSVPLRERTRRLYLHAMVDIASSLKATDDAGNRMVQDWSGAVSEITKARSAGSLDDRALPDFVAMMSLIGVDLATAAAAKEIDSAGVLALLADLQTKAAGEDTAEETEETEETEEAGQDSQEEEVDSDQGAAELFRDWVQDDSAAAEAWFLSRESRLPAPLRDAFAEVLHDQVFASETSDPKRLQFWSSKISNSDLRRSLEELDGP